MPQPYFEHDVKRLIAARPGDLSYAGAWFALLHGPATAKIKQQLLLAASTALLRTSERHPAAAPGEVAALADAARLNPDFTHALAEEWSKDLGFRDLRHFAASLADQHAAPRSPWLRWFWPKTALMSMDANA